MTEVCCGIYLLKCIPTGKGYVGSSYNCHGRMQVHRLKLTAEKHVNIFLQAAWNKYGPNAWTFEVLEHCERPKLREREQYWINSLNTGNNKHGFNLAPAIRQDKTNEHLSKVITAYWTGLSDEERNNRDSYKRTKAGRARLKQNAVDLWAKPDYRELMTTKVSATMKGHCKDPEIIAHRKKISNEYWGTKAAKTKMSRRMLNQWEKMPPDVKAKRLRNFVKPRETTRFLTLKGIEKSLKSWSEESGLPYGLLLTRLKSGTQIEKMFLPSYKHYPTEMFVNTWLDTQPQEEPTHG